MHASLYSPRSIFLNCWRKGEDEREWDAVEMEGFCLISNMPLAVVHSMAYQHDGEVHRLALGCARGGKDERERHAAETQAFCLDSDMPLAVVHPTAM